MPFPFILSTTSHLTFQQHFTSTTHPTLPSAATAQRNLLRSTLKTYKRLSSADQSNHLNEVLSALTSYLKYLTTIDSALSGWSVNDEDVDIALVKDVQLEWRPTLSSSAMGLGREADRVRGQGIDYEIYFVHHTCAVVQNLLARQALLGLYASSVPTAEQRLNFIQAASRHVRTACTIHAFLLQRANSPDGPPELPAAATDISISVQSALQRLAQAEFNLLSAFKDDPYPAIVVQARNDLDREWMIKAPKITDTRAQLLTRLCIGAAEQAAGAAAMLKAESKGVSRDLIDYVDDLRRTARARACRFQALDADTNGETGKGIAWIYAALHELGVEISVKQGSSKQSTLSKFKTALHERKEDKKITKASVRWGSDAGRAEETRILDYLEKKMVKANDTIRFEKVPDWKPLLSMLPSGTNMPLGAEKWAPQTLSEDELLQMRAPLEIDVMAQESSGDEKDNDARDVRGPAGAFPGTDKEYGEAYY